MTSSKKTIKITWLQAVVILLVLVFIVLNAFLYRQISFIGDLNSYLIIPLAVGTTAAAVLVVLMQPARAFRTRWMWIGLAAGWGLWMIAEVWWAVASQILDEVPYPSWADFFWLLGYVPLFIALWSRMRSLPRLRDIGRQVVVGLATVIIFGTAFFLIFLPVLRQFDPSTAFDIILSLLYPLFDFVLLVLVIHLFLSYQQGKYGRVWLWIGIGFTLASLGDLAFTYFDSIGQYYPEGVPNLSSTLFMDVPYTLSYLFYLVGLVTLWRMRGVHQSLTGYTQPLTQPKVPNTHVVIFTTAANTVSAASQNYPRVFLPETAVGKQVAEALGISSADGAALLADRKSGEILQEKGVTAETRAGRQPILVSGLRLSTPDGKYSGSTLLVRLFDMDYSLDSHLTNYDRGMVRSLLEKTDAGRKEEAEIKDLLGSYYHEYFKALYNRAILEGGDVLADAFLNELSLVSEKHNWKTIIQPGTLLDISVLSVTETRQALPVLLEAARQLMNKIADPISVEEILHGVRGRFNDDVMKAITHFETPQG